ncbi:MAG: TIM barrel protein [Clostridiales bacterium]|nr:TIM barrel protein [Clostridiales bacterium]
MIGLTSITFRGMAPREIIDLAGKAGLEGIEWGSDVHVPPGDIPLAKAIAAMCAEAGIRVTSYGSYFRAGQGEDPTEEIRALIADAEVLGAPVIRIWAGDQSPADADAEYRKHVESDAALFVRMAADAGIRVATEYHRHTLTENADSALELLQAVPGLMTYWQPNPDVSEETNLEELERVLPYLLNVHVFQWTSPGNIRHPLAEGKAFWTRCIRKVLAGPAREHHFLLEFVRDDLSEQCIEDAKALTDMIRGTVI